MHFVLPTLKDRCVELRTSLSTRLRLTGWDHGNRNDQADSRRLHGTTKMNNLPLKAPAALTYIDLFSGCGGLSLGLHDAGWTGVFAVERSPMAFETLRHNLIDTANHFPLWPSWLPKESCSIQLLTRKYAGHLRRMRGQVMLIAGGPPCQGFSHAGRRQKEDHRNQLYKSYIKVVELVRPTMVLLENVTGIKTEFGGKPQRRGPGRPPLAYSERIKRALSRIGYRVFDTEVVASDYGVPQSRRRFVAVGVDTRQFERCTLLQPFALLPIANQQLRQAKGLPIAGAVSCRDALSDLEQDPARMAACPDAPNYMSGKYASAKSIYQVLMRHGVPDDAIADSHRFVKHRPHIVERFARILAECPRGKNLPDKFRHQYGLKKACIVPLDPSRPSSTLTTIPDDMIHYAQPRVLTVRECARLQSFPDWYQFKSKYTTGGDNRKLECPRYTQIGNAVPPLLGEALGRALALWVKEFRPEAESDQATALAS